jgi:hypothetical protein
MTLFLLVLLAALVFEYINGFHDAANAIATVVSTKVMTPRQALAMAAFFNLIGALWGTAVASTIGKGLVDANAVTMMTVLCALLGAIIWNLFTWWLGLPSSSSHALVGGLCGAALSTSGGHWGVLHWATTDANGKISGLWPKVVRSVWSRAEAIPSRAGASAAVNPAESCWPFNAAAPSESEMASNWPALVSITPASPPTWVAAAEKALESAKRVSIFPPLLPKISMAAAVRAAGL